MGDMIMSLWHKAWHANQGSDDGIKTLLVVLFFLSLFSSVAGGAADVLGLPGQVARFVKQYLPVSFGAAVMSFLLLALLDVPTPMRWGGAAAALPAMLVLLQYVHRWAHQPREAETGPSAASPPAPEDDREAARRLAERAVESAYGPRTLFIRYGFPAILLLIEGELLFFLLVGTEDFGKLTKPEILHGTRFGATGAYAWVLLELGRRSFRRDVTGGIALWSVVTLALGPMLAATLALVWKMESANKEWQEAVVLFYAGFAPRSVLAVVGSAAAQLLRIGPTPTVETRTTPLTKIRGINPQIEERLAEEGIYNVETLATADPIRLMRDTSFDLRGILWWVDEALLMLYAPQRWQDFEEQGITGAVDLAALGAEHPPPDEALMAALALRVDLEVPILTALARRVRQDRHVNYLWLLYDRYVVDGNDGSPS